MLRETASALAFFHKHGVCVGDISPKNLLFSLAPREAVYFIDCDAMRIHGVSALPQVETPGWDTPAGEERAALYTDTYKLGLLALRLLAGDQDTTNPDHLLATTPGLLRQIITDTLTKPPHQRPLPEAWSYVLGNAIEHAQHQAKTPPPPGAAPAAPPLPVVHSRPPVAPSGPPVPPPRPAHRPPARPVQPAEWPLVPPPRPAEWLPTEIGTPPRRRWWRRGAIVIPAALVTVAVIAAAIVLTVITGQQHQNSNRPQITLPFTSLNFPEGVAVDAAGNLYVTDTNNNRVVKLAAGSSAQAVLPFTGLSDLTGVAVDTAGNLYATDNRNNRVLKLPAGSSTQAVLPFTGLNYPEGVGVDTAGNLYVTDVTNEPVVKLAAG